MSDIAVSKDLRSLFGPVRDQGSRPTCLAFAASDAHAALRPGWAPLSCEYAYFHALRRGGLPPTGGTRLSDMLDALREDGQPEESSWPYLSALPVPLATWLPPASPGPLYARTGTTAPPNFDDVVAWLEQDRPAIILCTLSASFYAPDASGVVAPAPGERPDPQRRHALVACGHGLVGEERMLLVRNSWGPRWGVFGHAWLTEAFLGPRLYAAAVLKEEVHVSGHSAAA